MSCDHPLSAEYLYSSDAVVLDLYEHPETESLALRFAMPCPDCDATLEATAPIEEVGETDLEIPIEGKEDVYD